MRQIKDAVTQNLAERLCWEVAQCCYGIFHLVEYSLRLGVRVEDKPPTHSCAKGTDTPLGLTGVGSLRHRPP